MSGTELKQRLAAILAADVAGYSRLMAANERATVGSLDAARAVFRIQIEANQGRVIDMAGDSVLAAFETATGAVSAALAVQQEINVSEMAVPEDRRMRFRIGVHLGDVIEKADGTVYGDGVNIAARLEGLAEPGGITISDAVQGAVRGKVAASFVDQGEQQVKNIPYPVRAFAVRIEGGITAIPTPAAAGIDLSLPDKPSIAVLPFTNMSGDPEQGYFTDGVTEDIITELSRFHSLFVIARNSTFTYKGKAVDVRTVAKELGVRYVLEGSIRRAANRVRVTAQLIDALTGNHIWAEKYDRVLEDIFAVQEEVTRSIVTSIAPEIQVAEQTKARRRPANLSAYEVAVRAWGDATEAMAKSDLTLRDQAIRAAREALLIDPESILALQSLAYAQWQNVFSRAIPDLESAWAEGMGAAQRAVSLDGSDSMSYVMRGILFCFPGQAPGSPGSEPRYDEALSDVRRAHELNPNDAFVLLCAGFCEVVTANSAKGIEYLTSALRNNPRALDRFYTMSILSMAHFLAKDYASGIEWGLKAAREAPRLLNVQNFLALNYVGSGEFGKAAAALEAARLLSPDYVQARLDGYSMYRRPEDRRRQTVFMRIAAGLEDPGAADALR
ncbi:MAG: adenylate/guanylate cyclase domain-containing protein [Betaproteobacteria bacterium]|nr:adenylate/guanylate cyclase domain-containing protein [Betaproteobacteria bacterium]